MDETSKGQGKTLRGDNHSLDCGNGFTGIYILEVIKLIVLNMCSLFYVNYSSVPLQSC